MIWSVWNLIVLELIFCWKFDSFQLKYRISHRFFIWVIYRKVSRVWLLLFSYSFENLLYGFLVFFLQLQRHLVPPVSCFGIHPELLIINLWIRVHGRILMVIYFVYSHYRKTPEEIITCVKNKLNLSLNAKKFSRNFRGKTQVMFSAVDLFNFFQFKVCIGTGLLIIICFEIYYILKKSLMII